MGVGMQVEREPLWPLLFIGFGAMMLAAAMLLNT
jgi:hypothetical protein